MDEEIKGIVAIVDRSAGNDSVGEMWQETKIFPPSATLLEVAKWADEWNLKHHGRTARRITISVPHHLPHTTA